MCGECSHLLVLKESQPCLWRVKPDGAWQSGVCLRRGSRASSSVFLKILQGKPQFRVLSVDRATTGLQRSRDLLWGIGSIISLVACCWLSYTDFKSSTFSQFQQWRRGKSVEGVGAETLGWANVLQQFSPDIWGCGGLFAFLCLRRIPPFACADRKVRSGCLCSKLHSFRFALIHLSSSEKLLDGTDDLFCW